MSQVALPRRSEELPAGHSVGAVPSVWAVIFNVWPDAPIYHALDAAPDRRARQTICGRAIGLYHPCLPMKHAEKFGVPCRSCWPEA